MTDDDETSEFLRRLFHPADDAPRDVVPAPGMTREDLKRMNDATGRPFEVTRPGEVILDPDGVPVGVGPPTTVTGSFGGVVITAADVERLGLTAEELARDFPNVRVMPGTRPSHDNDGGNPP